MKIGIFTYGTRGDVQPYIALALGLVAKGHDVTLAAPQNFKAFVEGFGIKFHALYGDAEAMMNSPEGQRVVKSENAIKLMEFFFKALYEIRVPLRESYWRGISNVDFIIANSATLPIVNAMAEKQQKKVALTYFMPPVVPTSEFPLADFDFLNFGWYNKMTYRLAHAFYWKFVKKETNELRETLGLPILKENLIHYITKQQPLDLYCISPSLIPQPKDWAAHHKITGFLTIPKENRAAHFSDKTPENLENWLKTGEKPIYIGFGSNGVGNTEKVIVIIKNILEKTNERVLLCTGWSVFEHLPQHPNLFVAKYINHETVLPQCKVGAFHGGAGTLATMLRNQIPLVLVSFYTDQPAWGKIVAKKQLGVHIPFKKLSFENLITAIKTVQSDEIKANIAKISVAIRNENGLENAVNAIETYFKK
jgi:sterol 3beta-glucosyltransferase